MWGIPSSFPPCMRLYHLKAIAYVCSSLEVCMYSIGTIVIFQRVINNSNLFNSYPFRYSTSVSVCRRLVNICVCGLLRFNLFVLKRVIDQRSEAKPREFVSCVRALGIIFCMVRCIAKLYS